MPTKIEKLTGPMITRANEDAGFSILDEDERRVRLSVSSETPYLRQSWFDDPWIEVLGHSDGEVDLSRLSTGGAPALYNHSSYSRENHVGVVEKVELIDGRLYADVRFSKRDSVTELWNDVKDGILTNVSVGYKIHERKLIKENKGGADEYRVTRWEPMEVSMVPLPADPTVGVGRSEKFEIRAITLTEEGTKMPAEKDSVNPDVETVTTNAERAATVDADSIRAEAVKAEQTRISAITDMCRKHQIRQDLADSLVSSTKTVEQARAAILDELVERQVHIDTHNRVEVGKSGSQRFIDDAVESIVARAGFGEVKAENQTRSYTLYELARRTLELAGVNTQGMDKMQLVGRAFTQSTSDFPVLLENAMHKTLQGAYRIQADTWSRFCRTGSVSDFRAHNRYRTGSLANLQVVDELGEFKNITIPDGEKSSVIAKTKGGIINLSRQTIINDDLGAFIGLAADLGRAARRTIETDVYALLALNGGLGPTMADGFALFSAEHNNIGSTFALSVEGLDSDRVVMAEQLDVGGNDFLDLRPAVLLVPLSLGGTARIINNAAYDPDAEGQLQRPNKVASLFRDIVDTPRLDGLRRYLFADPNEAPVIEVSFLDGNTEPFMEMQQGFTVDGSQWKVRLDYGVGVIDYRGAVTNDGIGES